MVDIDGVMLFSVLLREFSMEAFEIAQIIAKQKDANKQDGTDTSEAIDFVLFQIVADFEDYFESDNPNFDRNKFRVSCGF